MNITHAHSIRREDDANGGRYVLMTGGREAELSYVWRRKHGARVMVTEHTRVPDEVSGRGIGLSLVRRAVDDARADGFRIDPQCPYVAAMMDRHPELGDVRSQ